MHESQNKSDEDEKYLTRQNWIQIPTFSTRRQQLRNEGKSHFFSETFDRKKALLTSEKGATIV